MFFVVAVISLSLSLASFAVPSLATAMLSTATWLFGRTAITTVADTNRVLKQNAELRTRNQNLTRRAQALTQSNRDLTQRNARLSQSNRVLNERVSSQRRLTAITVRRIQLRTVRSTTRSIASIPLESVPGLGVTTIIATSAWEIREACQTLDDMDRIQRELGLEPDVSLASRACDLSPLQGARADYYGDMSISECRTEAQAAREQVFELARLTSDEAPDLDETEEDLDDDVRELADAEFKAINEICDCIEDLVCDPEELVRP